MFLRRRERLNRARRRCLDAVVDQFLGSGDFNGLYFGANDPDLVAGQDVVESLVRDGLLEVISEDDFPNPHIRPWPSRRDVDSQVETLRGARDGSNWGCCLYPTAAAMAHRDLTAYADVPYAKAMAGGRGHLELAYFTIDVISDYRDDARYHFSFEDFGARFGIGDDAYLDETEPERDKIHSINVGFAYDAAALNSKPAEVRRYVCAFYGDLAKLTPDHQQRWRTRRLDTSDRVRPHPVWWQMQMGQWPDALGPFEKILAEIAAINELWSLVYGRSLFHKAARPRNWGWVLRPSTPEWEAFVHTTDKLPSDNLDHKALTTAGVSRNDEAGNPLGSLTRLMMWLTRANVTEENARQVLGPLFDIRKERNPTAHKTTPPVTDRTLVARQRDLLGDVASSLQAIREFLATHPKACAANWTASDHITTRWYVL